MEPADRLELHELPGRYGDAIDDRNWAGLDRIFTVDATFDLTDLGVPLLEGLPRIRQFMDMEADHPRTHLMTNIYVDETAGRLRVVLRQGGEDTRRLAGEGPGRHATPPSERLTGRRPGPTHGALPSFSQRLCHM
jgi:SnoaL-like domain